MCFTMKIELVESIYIYNKLIFGRFNKIQLIFSTMVLLRHCNNKNVMYDDSVIELQSNALI